MLSVRKNTVTIFLKPYSAHYLRLKYTMKGNVIDLPRKSKIRSTFLLCINKNYTASDHKKLTGYTDSVEIFLNDDLCIQHGEMIHPAHASLFNSVLEEKIKNESFHIINLIRLKHNMNPKEAILEFQSMYGFADTFSFSAIKADYYRSLQEAEEIFLKKKTATKH